jgi:ParB family chromosome partitioning protein
VSAANILGITVRDLDKLVEIYDLSEKLKNLADPATSITWAREIRNLNKKLLTPTVLDSIIRRVNNQEITNSKDIRKLRHILRDPVARDEFLADRGTIDSAISKLRPTPSKKGQGLLGDIHELAETIRRYPWTTLASLKGDQQVLTKLEETEKLLKALKKALSR